MAVHGAGPYPFLQGLAHLTRGAQGRGPVYLSESRLKLAGGRADLDDYQDRADAAGQAAQGARP